MSRQRSVDLIAVLQGTLSEADFGARHGLTAREVELSKQHYLEGLAAATASTARPRRRVAVVLGSVLLVAMISRVAWAGTCAAPMLFPSALGLTHFCADEPALAPEMNDNITRLVALMAQKVGPLGTSDLSTTNAALTGALTANIVTATAVNANTLTPRTGSTVTASQGLSVSGQLDIGAYVKTCGSTGGLCYCNNTGERALTWSTTCTNVGHAVYAAQFSTDPQQRSGFAVSCYNVGNGQIAGAASVSILCARLTTN